MKKAASLFLVCSFIFSASVACAVTQQDEEEGIPPGMEVLKIGDARTIVIKGTRVKKKGDLLVVEGTKEFVARKFLDINNRVEALEAEREGLEKEIKGLRQELDELKMKMESE